MMWKVMRRLSCWWSEGGSRPAPGKGRKLGVEQLVDRIVPAATSFLNAGVLSIQGGDEAETFKIVSTAGDATNTVEIRDAGGALLVSMSGVTKARVFSNGGNDVLDASGSANGAVAVELNGGDGDDVITGSAFADVLNAGAGDDVVNGGDGNDTIDGGLGRDVIDGGAGNDLIYGGYQLNDDTSTKSFGTVNGTAVNGTFNDVLFGGAGDDTVRGGSGGDYIAGGDGADILEGNLGNDVIYGDQKSTLGGVWSSAAGRNVSAPGDGNDTIYGDEGADYVYGGGGADLIYGLDGDDNLYGNLGNDTIYGGDGNDNLNGGDDDDTLSGQAGNDTLQAGQGNDKLFGGLGSDTFDLAERGVNLLGYDQADGGHVVTDASSSDYDKAINVGVDDPSTAGTEADVLGFRTFNEIQYVNGTVMKWVPDDLSNPNGAGHYVTTVS